MPEVGQQIGTFVLREWIASDKHTSLFRATPASESTDQFSVAIRAPNVRGDKTARGIIKREYSILSLTREEHLPQALTFVDSDSALIRTWIEGVSLNDVIQSSVTITPTSAIAIVLEVSALLQNIHQYMRKNKNLVYGRLCPSHIIVTPDGEISLIGLGRNPWNNAPYFTSPEQAQQAFLDWRTDQWSLGALLLYLLTKTKPYGDKTNPFGAAKNAHISPYLSQFQRDYPSLFPTISKMLCKAAGERFSSDELLCSRLLSSSAKLHGKGDLDSLYEQTPKNERTPKLQEHTDIHVEHPMYHDERPQPVSEIQYTPIEAPPKPIERIVELADREMFIPTEEVSISENIPMEQTNYDSLNKLERVAIVFVIINTIAIIYLMLNMS